MILIPAIDLMGKKVVRLTQGEKERKTEYPISPVELALRYQEAGARLIHVVDLDRAFTGESENFEVIAEIIKNVSIPVQVGGGIRNIESFRELIEIGAFRVIVGTIAVTNPELLEAMLTLDRDKVAVGIDAKNGWVAIKGWVESSNYRALDLAYKVKEMGVNTIIYTDIARDGSLTGPNFNETLKLYEETGLRVIASGGISGLEDLKRWRELGENKIYGVIAGKAILEGKIDLKEGIRILEGES